jgi:uncharacterized protein (TIGR02996 family)
MTAYEELLRDVTSNPDDDRARLAFASHVRSSEPDRARFIELQVDSARESRARGDRSRVQRVSVEAEWRQLLRKHDAEWTRPLAKYVMHCTFDRDFVTGVSIDPYVFLEYGEWLLLNGGSEPVLREHRRHAPVEGSENTGLLKSGAYPAAPLDGNATR